MHWNQTILQLEEDVVAEVELGELKVHIKPSDRELANIGVGIWRRSARLI